jgi:hypothetical protein
MQNDCNTDAYIFGMYLKNSHLKLFPALNLSSALVSFPSSLMVGTTCNKMESIYVFNSMVIQF